jgi:1-acyl-sn-glycerol-3-phosphate acyltransferase
MAKRRTVLAGSPVFWLFLKFVLLGPWLRLMFRPKVTGLEYIPREGGAIIASNHVSFLDGLMLPLVVPHRRVMYLTKVKYIDKPVLRWILTGAGVIPVATDDLGAARSAVTAAAEAVHSGRLVGIFPEGTRSPDGELQSFFRGAFVLATRNDVPVVPVVIEGTGRILGKGSRRITPVPVVVRVLPPISPASVGGDDRKLRDRVHEAMTAELAKIRAR